MTNLNSIRKYFKNKKILEQALTHRSWVNENPKKRGTNERLEFLGDAILEFVVSKEIYEKFPNKEEGYLTALRANIVNTRNLSLVAKKLALGKALYLSKGEEETGGRENPSLLADTVEALIGAFYIDQGLEKTEAFIKTNILNDIKEKLKHPLKDAKSRLQEIVQAKSKPAPKYVVVEESGPDHNKKFITEVVVNGKVWGRGIGKSKGEAEQAAATKALDKHTNL
jgi:ribonuclease-3